MPKNGQGENRGNPRGNNKMKQLFEIITLYCWMECSICRRQFEAGKESKWVKIQGKNICLDCFERGIMWSINGSREEYDV